MRTSTESAVSIQGLVKKYGERAVVDGVSLEIEKGAIFGLLGPNGAGKSSIINIISGISRQTSGEVFVLGKNIKTHLNECKMQIGTAIQEVFLDPFFSVETYLTFIAGYYGITGKKARARIEEVCFALNLTEHLKKNTRLLSGGMKRRLIIAKALLHDPEVLILDEPTAGVDIELRNSLWQYVESLNKQGKTIILTTHYLEEAQNFCHKIAFIEKGKIILNDSKQNILKNIGEQREMMLFMKTEALEGAKNLAIEMGASAQAKEGFLTLNYNKNGFSILQFFQKLNSFNIEIEEIKTKEKTLDDVFISIFKKYV